MNGEETPTENAERFRLFIAIRIPEAAKDEIEMAQSRLKKSVPEARIRWTTRDQFHLTMRFLGNVDAPRVDGLTQAIRGACQGFAPLPLRAEGVGFFPDGRFPRVVWVGVHDSQDQLLALQRAVQDATRDFTTEKPEGKFTGHVTLGRIKGIRRPETDSLCKAASALAERLLGEWPASEVELIRSRLSPSGAQYQTLVAVPLVPQSVLPDTADDEPASYRA